MLNLRSKFFQNFLIYRALCTLNFSGGCVWPLTFFGHTKFEVKNFSEFFHSQSTFDSEFFASGHLGSYFLCHAKFEVKIFSESFPLLSAVDSKFLKGCIWAPTFFGCAKFEVKNFLEFFHLLSTVDSEFLRGGRSGH